ncbi:MAG TPA: hypothetical protein RMH85_35440 [Polyangiaceae bacterium LLY-WYZ-15_(1-7)]|nr:hypothetical protein [Sandaracinus sp.]HJK89812.1 hypothetical protein [Polyangiaceae bacterium LLY-WYZ-15_(1-7)]MBJ71752.1 hypothetical protein [Sandaracinus sp.]HJL05886.1 hypothetical protein [Polyangiaceae bacterium LLY-WYZ-15_(1-7)]HJL13835.1 hypothetical protein [Polyangiaceae bacterium LLY-WYZ-15_(1-7)]
MRARPGPRAPLALVAILVGCGGGEDVASLVAEARPHVEHYRDFERWARRAVSADAELRDREAFEETLFAPLVLESQVRGALVEVGEGPPRLHVHGALGAGAEGEELAWRGVRVDGESLEVATPEGGLALRRGGRVAGRVVRVVVVYEASPE